MTTQPITFQHATKTFELRPIALFRLVCTDLQEYEGALRVPNNSHVSAAAGEELECIEWGGFNDMVFRRVADRPTQPEPEDAWEQWHRCKNAPADLGQPHYWRKWLQWAVARFELFRHLPQPGAYNDGSEWAQDFDRAAIDEFCDRECHWLARVLLECWNVNTKWKCPKAPCLYDLALRLDPENRRGLAAIIIHAKGIG